MKRLLFTTTILFYYFFYNIQCINDAPRNGKLVRLNNQQIAVFYNAVLNLLNVVQLTPFDRLDYMSYFDGALQREINYFLARLRGYATNEVQAADWENHVSQVLRVYVVRTCVRQASSYYDAFAAVCHEPGQPQSLLTQCIRAVSNHYFRDLEDNFPMPNIPDAIVSHELSRLMRMPIFVTNLDAPPYLRLHLTANRQRFVDTVSEERRNYIGFRDPIPFSPYKNYMNDLLMLRRAIQTIAGYWRTASCDFYSDMFTPNSYVSHYPMNFVEECVDRSLYAQAETTLREIFANSRTFFAQRNTNFLQHNIIMTALLNLVTRFLDADHNWLAAHPLLYLDAQHRHQMTTITLEINELYLSMEEMAEQFIASLEHMLEPFCMSDAMDRLRERLEEQGFAAGYTLRRFVNIAVVQNSQVDGAESTSTESSADKTTQSEYTIAKRPDKSINYDFFTPGPLVMGI